MIYKGYKMAQEKVAYHFRLQVGRSWFSNAPLHKRFHASRKLAQQEVGWENPPLLAMVGFGQGCVYRV